MDTSRSSRAAVTSERRRSHRGRGRGARSALARLAIGVVALHVRRRQLPAAESGDIGRRPPRRRPRPTRRCSLAAARSTAASAPGRAGRDRAPRRLLRRARRHGGGALHVGGRPFGRRLHGAPVDPRRAPAARSRRRHAVEVTAPRRPPLVALRAAAAADRRHAVRRVCRPVPGRGRVRRHPRGARARSARRSRRRLRGRRSSRPATDCGSEAGTSLRGTGQR